MFSLFHIFKLLFFPRHRPVLEEMHGEKGRYAPEKGWLVLSDRGGGGRGSRE